MSFQKLIPVHQNLDKALQACIFLFYILILTITSASALTNQEITRPLLQTDITSTQIEKDKLIIGSEQDYPPFSTGMTDETAGGFTVDLWKAVAAEAGLKYTIRVKPFHELLNEFKEGKIDILLNLATSKERHLFADFTVPHAVIHGGIFVRIGESSINSESDLTGKSIIVLNGDLAHDYATSKGLSKQLILVNTAAEGMKLLASGKYDAMLISKLAGMQTLQKFGISNIKALKASAGFEQKFAFGVREGHSELLSNLNETLVLLKTNGTYDKLYEKWFGIYEKKEATLIDVLKYLLPVLIAFLAIALYSINRRRKEIRAAQKALQESEHTLSEVLENVGSFIFLKDINGHYLYANRKVCELFGTTLEAIVGQSDEQFFDAATVEQIRNNDKQVLLEGKTLRTEETNLTTKNGVPATYLVVKLPLRNDLGEIYALCGISTEITDLKLIETELEKNISLLNATLESTTDAILVVDLNNSWLSKNQRFIDLWHIPEDILSANNGSAALSFMLDQLEDPESFLNKVHELYNTPEASSFDTFKFKNGKIIERNSLPQIIGSEIVGRVWNFRDVTESKQADAKLKQSESYSRAIIESSPVPLALNDIHGNITYLNAAFIQTLGYTLSDIPTLADWWPHAYPDANYRQSVTERWQRNLDEAKLNNSPFTPIEINVRCKDNSTRTFLCSSSIIQGEFAGNHLVVLYDITERKEAESEIKKMRHALVESHERYVDLYEFAPIGYLSLNKHGLITEVNWKVTALLGLQRKELTHHRLAEFVAEVDADHWRRTFSDLKNLVDGEEYSFDLKLIHSQGAEFTASLICMRMDDANDQPMIRITMIDVTKLKQAEAKIASSEAYLSAIIENEPECIKIVDAKGYLKKMNPAGLIMLEAETLEQATSIPLLNFITPAYHTAFKDMHKRVIAGESMQLEFEVIGLKGGRRWLETHAVPMLDGDKKTLLGVTRDITARKQAEMHIEKLLAEQTAILDNKMVGIVIERDRKIVWANLAYEIMLGYSKKELIGMPMRNLYLNEEDYQSIGAEYVNIEHEGIVRSQYSFVRKNGQQIWLDLSGSMLNKDLGESLWIFVDVSAKKQAEMVAGETYNLLESVINTAPMRIFWKDKDSRYLGCNPAFAKDAGKDSPKDIIGKLDYEMPWATQAELYRADDLDVIKTGVARLSYDEPQLTPSGNIIWLRTSKVPLKNQNNEPLGVLGFYEDITERKLAEIELRIAATAFESQEGIMIAGVDRNILRVNSAFTKITGYSADEVVGKNPHMLSSGLHTKDFYDAIWNTIHETGTWQGEIWNKRKNGEIYLEYLTIATVNSSDGELINYVATLSDITQGKLAADEIEQLAFYDSLSGLPNRRLMVDRLSHALSSSTRSGNRGAVLFLDLDHFKSLNDTLGHDVGDLLLKQVGARLKECVREDDTVARIGGDEYVIVLEELSDQAIEAARQAEVIGNNILAALNKPYQLGTYNYHSTVSMGIAIFSGHDKSEEELLKHADIAMYQAKKAGRNTLRFFDPIMQEVIQARVSLENDLRSAIENQEFLLHYQVQVDFLQQPIGVEALIRWQHPERGLISPFTFIRVLEETGLILPVGQWVLETACAQIKTWQHHEHTSQLTISVNVSAKQFHQTDFISRVKVALALYDISPKLLKLELTESILLENIEDTIIKMNELKELGIMFSLDDFGTGYSSLQYLKRLPLYQLKIDQSFVRDIVVDNNDQAIIRTIIAMAHMLDLNVIAEGVETLEQQQILLSNGCTHYQGYLFGKPMPIEQLESALQI